MYKKLKNHNNVFNYFLVKSKNRTKNMTIRLIDNLVYVYVPKTINQTIIDSFINKNKEQILNHLNSQPDNERFIKYLGEKYEINVVDSKLLKKPFCSINKIKKIFYIYKPNMINLDLESTINSWKKAELYKIIIEKIKYFLKNHNFNYNLDYNKLTIKNMISKWGSCSFRHNLNFNIHLLEKREEIIDYLIIHELTHTIHFNHSKEFWQHVSNIIPNYLELRKELKENS